MTFPNAGDVNTATRSGVKEYVFAKMATQQATNVATGDHLKLDTVVTSRGGSVSLDTATAYVTTIGAASIGRFTLKAGLTYRLRASIPYVLASGATGLVNYGWYDATGDAALPGSQGAALVATQAEHEIGGGYAEAIFSPGVDSLVELRFILATAVTQYGTTTTQTPSAFVETI